MYDLRILPITSTAPYLEIDAYYCLSIDEVSLYISFDDVAFLHVDKRFFIFFLKMRSIARTA